MVALNGLEKFSHLEDKIYRTIELAKTLRQEKDELERQLATVRGLGGDKQQLIAQIERLLAEREAIRTRVQAMLEAVAAADPELAEAIRGSAQTLSAPIEMSTRPQLSKSKSTTRPIPCARTAIRNTSKSWQNTLTCACARFLPA